MVPFCGCDESETVDFVADGNTDVLVVGLEGSGKTLLTRRLAALHRKDKAAAFTADTVSTAGIELHQAACGKGSTSKRITLREVGGQMLPIWPQYFDDCKVVMFVVDMANSADVAFAVVELYELLRHDRLQDKPFGIVLTKNDLPATLSRSELDLVMNLGELQRMDRVTVLETSAMDTMDAQKVMDWVVENVTEKEKDRDRA